MKTLFAFLALLLVSQIAPAEAASECRSITQSKVRLACYDRLDDKSKAPAAAETPAFKDLSNPFSAEEARTSARLKGICRGC
jgi:hypothetical protein